MRKVIRFVFSVLSTFILLAAMSYGHEKANWNLSLPRQRIYLDLGVLLFLALLLVSVVIVMNKENANE